MKRFVSLVAGVLLVVAGISAPASASETSLPSGLGVSGNPSLRGFVCSDSAELWLPVPVKENPISSIDFRYSNFEWKVFESGNVEVASVGVGSWSDVVWGLSWEPGTLLTPGQDYTVNVVGTGDSDTPSSFEHTFTVMDSVFSGSGQGTAASPYIVTSLAEFNEMRCIKSAYWQLAADLDFSSVPDGTYVPFSFESMGWRGVIDGNGHTIRNLTMGHPQQDRVSLLGGTRYTSVIDLRIENFDVTGARYTAPLVSTSQNGSTYSGITIRNTEVNSFGPSASLLVADCNSGCGMKGLDIQGGITVLAPGLVNTQEEEISSPTISKIGGVVGNWSGSNGGFLTESAINVDIVVRPESNFQQIALDRELDFDAGSVYEIGSLIGDSDEDFLAINNTSTSTIRVESFGNINAVGGAVGYGGFPLSGLDLDVSIDIVKLDDQSSPFRSNVREIGGALGKADDIALSRSKVNSVIHISNATSSNNYHRINNASGGYQAKAIGGVYGEYNDDTADFLNEIDTQVVISGAGEVFEVGGYAGFYNDTYGLNPTEVVLTGAIEIEGASVRDIGGFVGSLRNRGILSGWGVVSAMRLDVDVPGGAPTNVGSVSGKMESPETNFPSHFYWDQSINDYGNPVGHNYLPATTAQLTNRSFVAAAGFDMENSWELNGSYPELRPGVYRGQHAENGSLVPSTPSVTVVTSGQSSFGPAGGLLQLEGDGLRGLGQVKLGGQSLFVQTLSGTTAAVLIPAGLSAGSYDLEVTGLHGTLRMQSAVTITAPSVDIEPGYWTQLQPDGTVKMYAKNIIGEGKVQFYQNGQEITWINATDALDPKLSSANGFYYLVRTRELVNGKNPFEIYLNGTRIWRAAYSKR